MINDNFFFIFFLFGIMDLNIFISGFWPLTYPIKNNRQFLMECDFLRGIQFLAVLNTNNIDGYRSFTSDVSLSG